MNNKGQVGMIVMLAIAVIVGLILFQPVATNVEQVTRTNTGVQTQLNQTITISSLSSGGIVELNGQELVSTLQVINSTTGTVLPTTNYTIAECVRTSDNLKGICYTKTTAGNAFPSVNVSYTYYPAGYADDAGARSIAGIIVLLTAIAVFLVVLSGSKWDY